MGSQTKFLVTPIKPPFFLNGRNPIQTAHPYPPNRIFNDNFNVAMQVPPTKDLSHFIKHYLFLESDGHAVKKLRLFSDGNTGMVFCFKNRLISRVDDTDQLNNLPDSFVYGQIAGFKDLYLANEASLIIIVFNPDGIYRLLGIFANEIRDRIICTGDLFGIRGTQLHDQLAEQPGVEEKISLLNAFFLQLIPKHSSSNEILIRASLNFINRNRAGFTLKQLVKHTGYTERHIERTFGEAIGVSPKKFGNILKLHSFIKVLKEKTAHDSITPFCYEVGYFDQSHLIKEFRKYTGITPTQYLSDTSRLTTNFVAFNAADLRMSDLYNLVK